ncbi:UNVERIFIED_CONTAM: hypothetical protein K2H54_021658 [Gekko kuhli]
MLFRLQPSLFSPLGNNLREGIYSKLLSRVLCGTLCTSACKKNTSSFKHSIFDSSIFFPSYSPTWTDVSLSVFCLSHPFDGRLQTLLPKEGHMSCMDSQACHCIPCVAF